MTTTATKELPTQKESQKAEWVALIYYPVLEIERSNQDDLIIQRRGGALVPFMRNFQFQVPVENYYYILPVHGGTNLGYHIRNPGDNTEIIKKLPVSWFNAIFSQPANRVLLNKKIIVPVYPNPDSVLDDQLPQYADFDEESAIKLVKSHTHEKWIDLALVTENRPVIKSLSEVRKQEILSNRKQLQEGE